MRPRWPAGTGPVAAAVRGGLSRRRVQTMVIGMVVVVSAAAATLALGLLVDSRAPFDHAFAAQRGAQLTVTASPARVGPGRLAAAGRLAGVTTASGPFTEVTVAGLITLPGGGELQLPPLTLAGRASPGGRLDDITLDAGRWAQRPGEVVLSRDARGPAPGVGQQIRLTGLHGAVWLTVVGVGKSVTDSAGGWVTPREAALLRAAGAPAGYQMLYRFQTASTSTQLAADLAALRAGLPAGAITAAGSYLSTRLQATESIAPIVPFVVAFGVVGLILSVLIVANVVSGAVVSGYRRIGILKSIGFTPGQVVAAYVAQVVLIALAGGAAGVALGNLLAVPLLRQTAGVYGVGALTVPLWVSGVVAAAVCALVALAALLPAWRAGRLSAIEAIATGRAPGQHRGYAAHRLLGRLPLPRSVSLGLAAPFARPARTVVTAAAILCGAATVTFAAGLSATLGQVAAAISHSVAVPVQVGLPGTFAHLGHGPRAGSRPAPPAPASPAAQQRAVEAALRAVPGTRRYAAEAVAQVTVAGLAQQVPVHAFRGDARWAGYDLISGRWYQGPGEVDVPTYFLTATGTAVGDRVTLSVAGRTVTVRIAGQVFDTENRGLAMLADWGTLARLIPGLVPQWYDVALRPGVQAESYAAAVGGRLGPGYDVSVNANDPFFVTLLALIGTLTLMLIVVAGLGAANTVLLGTRERVHDLGVFKAVGMTPRQSIAMVICWVAGPGLLAGIIAVPAGVALHRYVVPVMASSVGTGLPASFLRVYPAGELALLALAGLVIAVAAALVPAGWAARAAAAAALRAE